MIGTPKKFVTLAASFSDKSGAKRTSSPRPIGSSLSVSSLQLNTEKSTPKIDCSAFAAVDGLKRVVQGACSLVTSRVHSQMTKSTVWKAHVKCQCYKFLWRTDHLCEHLWTSVWTSVWSSVWTSHLRVWNYLQLICNASRLQEISHEKIMIYLDSFLFHSICEARFLFLTLMLKLLSCLTERTDTVLLSHGKYKHVVDYIRSSGLFYSDCAMVYPNFFTKYNQFFMFRSVSFCLSFLGVLFYLFFSFRVLVFGGIFRRSAF